MKRYLILIFSALITSLTILTGCQDEDFGFTQEEVFKGAYKRNFEAKYGKIDPNQSWDLSTVGKGKSKSDNNGTRSGGGTLPFPVDDDGYYRIENGTLNWIDSKLTENTDNSSLGYSFGMLLAGQEFIAIPISQKGTNVINEGPKETWATSTHRVNGTNYYYKYITTTSTTHEWTLYMVTLENGETPVATPLWSKNSANNIQTPNSETVTCDKCSGYGMVKGNGTVPCDGCAHQGYLPGTTDDCPFCRGDGKVRGLCTKCDADGHIECQTCKGKGYVPTDGLWIIITTIPRYTGCPDCLEPGSNDKRVFTGNIEKLGNRIQNCGVCHTTKETDVDCEPCGATGKMKKCVICDGAGYGITCDKCNGDRFLTLSGWEDIPSPYNTGDLGTHLLRSNYYEQKDFPDGSIVYFYMEVTPIVTTRVVTERWDRNKRSKVQAISDETNENVRQPSYEMSSLSENMIILNCPSPNNINEDYQVMVIGCEEGDHTNKDYNDLVFLVIGKPLPEVFEYTSGKDVTTSYKKQYMVEDMGSAVDWDFNDIVIYVKHDINRKLTESGGIVKKMDVTNVTKAVVRYFCGTIPIRVQIGDTSIPSSGWIDNPTAVKATTQKLGIEWPSQADDPGEKKGWSPTEQEITISGYDPDNNNITVWAKQGKDKTENDGSWEASFPKTGETPYIIATDPTIRWMDEGGNIPDSWWKTKADNTTVNNTTQLR